MDVLRECGLTRIKMALHNTLLAIDIMNEPRWRVGDTVATGLLKINPDFFSIKTPEKPR